MYKMIFLLIRCPGYDKINVYGTENRHADMVELADTQVLGACARAYGFESHYPHHIRPHGQAVKTSPFHGGNSGSIPDGVTRSKFMQKLLHLYLQQMQEFCRICKNIEICIPIEYISFSLTVYLPFIS